MIKINNLNFYLKKNLILNNLSLEIKKGEYVSLLGQNGSGKSILALLIAKLNDNPISEIKTSKDVALIFENPDNQIIGTTVEEDIAFGLQNIQTPREEIENKINLVLKKLNIENLKKREITSLSGGQKQKLAFASLLALDYDIYILDEITSMLDFESKQIVLDLIKQLHNEGKTIIQITHFLDEVELTKRSIVMKNGSIVFDGNSKDLLNDEEILKQNNLI